MSIELELQTEFVLELRARIPYVAGIIDLFFHCCGNWKQWGLFIEILGWPPNDDAENPTQTFSSQSLEAYRICEEKNDLLLLLFKDINFFFSLNERICCAKWWLSNGSLGLSYENNGKPKILYFFGIST